MEIYIIIYGLLFLTVFIETPKFKLEVKKKVILFFVFIFTLFRGLRWKTGTDWNDYYLVFKESGWAKIFSFNRYGTTDEVMEFGYVLSNTIIKSLGGDYTAFLLISNLFILYSYYIFSLKFSKTPLLTFIIIIGLSSFFPVRQNIAVAITLLSYPYIINKQFLKFAGVILAAASFHISALVMIPVYFFALKKTSAITSIALYLASILINVPAFIEKIGNIISSQSAIIGSLITAKAKTYTDLDIEKESVILGGGISTNFITIVYIILFSRYRNKFRDYNPRINLFYNFFLLSKILEEMFRYSFRHLQRLSEYFYFGFPVLFAVIITNISPKYRSPVYILFIIYIMYRFLQVLLNFYPKLHIPYKSIFD